MNISVKLDKDFTNWLDYLCKKYGEEFEKINGFSENNLNLSGFIDAFIGANNTANATIDSNANVQSKDVSNLINEIPKPYLKLLGFNKVFYEIKKKFGLKRAREFLEAEWRGDIFTHNSSQISTLPYCWNYDLQRLATDGMFFIENLKTKPAQHLTTFCDHVLEFVSWVSNRQSGASGIANVLMWLFWFWKKDVEQRHYIKDPEYYRDQCFQKFCFDLNMPYLRVTQASYTNVSIFDKVYCEEAFGNFIYPDGMIFAEHVDEFIEFQKAFLVKLQEMRATNIFTYPVMTYCLVYRDDKFVDEPFARWLSKHNMMYADANFLVSGKTTSFASCCRLLNDTSSLKDAVVNSIGGSSLGIGSISVITLNLAGYSAAAATEDEFFQLLEKNEKLVLDVNDRVRHIIKRNIEKGLLPNYKEGLIDMSHQFSTVGINGLYEAAKRFGYVVVDEMGYHFYTLEGIQFAKKVLNCINKLKEDYTTEYAINCEQTPMENGAIKLAAKNTLLYNTDEYITANQWIALKDKATVQARAQIAGILDQECGGGVITHYQLDAPLTSEETAWNLLNYIARQGGIYFAFNLKINVDSNKHTFTTHTCPFCGEAPVDTYQRCVGYLVPASSWSEGRKRELKERDWMNLNDAILS